VHSGQRPQVNIARGSLGGPTDGIQEGLERGFRAPEVTELVLSLQASDGRQSSLLNSLKRRDPERDRGETERHR